MKVLILDIETKPHVVLTWGLFKQTVGLSQIVKPGGMMCWAAKWLGEDEIFFESEHKDEEAMLVKMWELLDEADAVLHFNGKSFDMKHINTAFMRADMPPPEPYQQIDILLAVRKIAKFPSNKLDWLLREFKIGTKVANRGMGLWVDCMAGDDQAWVDMEEYNVGDIVQLEKLYLKVRPWITNHPHMGIVEGHMPSCPNCGTTKIQSRGTRNTRTMVYRSYWCTQCFARPRGVIRLKQASPNRTT